MRYTLLLMVLISFTVFALDGRQYRISNETSNPVTVTYTIDYNFGPGTCVTQKERLSSEIPTGIADFFFKTPIDFNCPGYTRQTFRATITITSINGDAPPSCFYQETVTPYENGVTMVIRQLKDGNWQCYPETDL